MDGGEIEHDLRGARRLAFPISGIEPRQETVDYYRREGWPTPAVWWASAIYEMAGGDVLTYVKTEPA